MHPHKIDNEQDHVPVIMIDPVASTIAIDNQILLDCGRPW
jgi:hypothetical protein